MANEHVGALQEIAFKVESLRGTAEDPASGDWYPHTGQGFIPQVEQIVNDSGMGRIESRLGADVAKEYSQGSVSMRLYDNFLTPLNRMIFGAAGTGTPVVYTVDNDNLHNSYTITCSDPVTGDTQYAKGMLNTLTMNANTDDYVSLDMEFIAEKEGTTTVTPGYSTTADLFVPGEITVVYADDFAGLGTGTSITCKNFQLNIEKNVAIDWAVNSTEPDEITNGRMTVSGELTMTYDATTLRALALAGTSKALQITLNNTAFSWDIKLPSADLHDFDRDTSLDDTVTHTIGFSANYQDETNGLIQAVVTSL